MTHAIRSRSSSIPAATIGLAAGGVGVQLMMPLLREADPLGLTPIAVAGLLGGGALGWYLRGRADRRSAAERA